METKVKKVGGRWRHLLAVAALPLLFATAQPAQATTATTPFQLDANPQDTIPHVAGSDDWDTPPSTSSGATKFTGIIRDTAPLSIHGGGDKDIQNISQWNWTNGSVPDKDDLTHAYAAAYQEDDDLLLYFGADRFANVGDAFMGFWFFKDKITALPNGKFSGEHKVGDTLVLIDFPQGSRDHPEMAVLTWDPTCSKAASNNPQDGDCAAANLRLKKHASGVDNATTVCIGPAGSAIACALTNTGDVPVPGSGLVDSAGEPISGLWSAYTPKSGTQGTFPFESFFEGGINFSEIVGSADGCFSSFMAETRASSSFTAALKDWVLGSFELCKVDITKTCTDGTLNATETGFVFDFEGSVTNNGFGTIYNVVVTDDNGTPQNTGDDFVVATYATIAKGATEDYTGSFNSPGNEPTNGISVKAASSASGQQTITAATTADCPLVDREPGIDVTKNCSTRVIDAGTQLVVRVDYSGTVCNTTGVGVPGDPGYKLPISLNNVTVTDDHGTADTSDDVVHNIGTLNATTRCANYSGSYTPSSAGSEIPGSIAFSDTVTATGAAPLNFGTPVDTATANCRLCPTCPTCPPNPN